MENNVQCKERDTTLSKCNLSNNNSIVHLDIFFYLLMVHLPKHWFHMVLETGYEHLCHQMKSVFECSFKQVFWL